VVAPERVRLTQRHVVRGLAVARRSADSSATGRPRCAPVADLDVPARHAVSPHVTPVLFRRLVVLQHRLDDKGGEIALSVLAQRAGPEVVIQDLDRRLRHQFSAVSGVDRDHHWALL
jgi:hypothetical protein